MSVIVKGMEMPKCCYDCPFIRASFAGDYYCAKGKGDEDDLKKLYSQRMADCPLTELPPHGRLIDADKFAETLKKVSIMQGYDKLFSDNILSVGDVFDAIATDLKGEGLDKYKLAPTVIEAEGETE